MAEESEPTIPAASDDPIIEVAEEYIEEDAFIIVSEKSLLEMLRQITSGQDADLIYAEFWANNAVEQIFPECTCCICDEADEDCECECTCELTEEDDG